MAEKILTHGRPKPFAETVCWPSCPEAGSDAGMEPLPAIPSIEGSPAPPGAGGGGCALSTVGGPTDFKQAIPIFLMLSLPFWVRAFRRILKRDLTR